LKVEFSYLLGSELQHIYFLSVNISTKTIDTNIDVNIICFFKQYHNLD